MFTKVRLSFFSCIHNHALIMVLKLLANRLDSVVKALSWWSHGEYFQHVGQAGFTRLLPIWNPWITSRGLLTAAMFMTPKQEVAMKYFVLVMFLLTQLMCGAACAETCADSRDTYSDYDNKVSTSDINDVESKYYVLSYSWAPRYCASVSEESKKTGKKTISNAGEMRHSDISFTVFGPRALWMDQAATRGHAKEIRKRSSGQSSKNTCA